MKIDKRLKIVIAAVILAACAFGGYTYYQSQQTAKQAKAIETADVVRKDLRSTVSATGTISPVDSVEVSPKITARISQVLVKENDKVTAGQTVAMLDGKDYEAKRDQAQYKVTNTKVEYDRAQQLYDLGAGTKQAYANRGFVVASQFRVLPKSFLYPTAILRIISDSRPKVLIKADGPFRIMTDLAAHYRLSGARLCTWITR